MPRYAVGHSKAGVNTANTVQWAIKAGAGGRSFLLELALFVEAAPTTPPIWRLLRPNVAGISSATTALQQEDGSDGNAGSVLETAFTTAPTLQATPIDLRRFALATAIGSGIIWTFRGDGLVIPASTELLIVNGNAAGATVGTLGMYAVITE